MRPRNRAATVTTPATVALDSAGVAYVLHPYRHDPNATSYGAEAAEQLGVPASRVFKTLLAQVDNRLVVAIVPVSGSLDLKALAAAAAGKRAAMADPRRAERTTGYVTGGISPLGQRTPLPTFLDESALDHSTIYVSAGRRGVDVEVPVSDLARLTNATTAQIGRTA